MLPSQYSQPVSRYGRPEVVRIYLGLKSVSITKRLMASTNLETPIEQQLLDIGLDQRNTPKPLCDLLYKILDTPPDQLAFVAKIVTVLCYSEKLRRSSDGEFIRFLMSYTACEKIFHKIRSHRLPEISFLTEADNFSSDVLDAEARVVLGTLLGLLTPGMLTRYFAIYGFGGLPAPRPIGSSGGDFATLVMVGNAAFELFADGRSDVKH